MSKEQETSVLPVSDAARAYFKGVSLFPFKGSTCEYLVFILSKQLLSIPRLQSTALVLMFLYIDRLLELAGFLICCSKTATSVTGVAANQTQEDCIEFGIFRAEACRAKPLLYSFPDIAFSRNLCTKVFRQYLLQIPTTNNFCKQNNCMDCRIISCTILIIV